MDTEAVKLEPNLHGISNQRKPSVDDANLCSTSPICAAPVCRQFWKAGIYNDKLTPKSTTQSGSTYLHIHPKFLHSNATSHKWAFGAVAELIDNAVDEIQNGATFVIIDKTTNPRNGSAALLVQDDGGGMDPEAMRRCLSFGFSDKKSKSAIGKYGNGFKTSSMRLGADVIVFSRNITDRTMTQSIGLLSYTFLTRAGYDRIVVPMVHYEFNFITGSFDCLESRNNENSNSNLSMLLQWSPYSTEEELLKQFDDVGSHGTKVIIYNLWLDEEGNMELDFESDPEDIRITWDGHSKVKDGSRLAVSEQHIANRLRYSLHAYLSMLYLKLPDTFAMVLRGKVIIYHNVATDLKYTEFIMYKPQSASVEEKVVTTIGFIKEAPLVNVHGFNVYHKNRLILPFWPVVSFSSSRGRGVVGVLEANFIEPTHDKQDFEKTSVFQKLVYRLKEMTWEYWDYHCGLLGYHIHKKPRPPSTAPGSSNFVYQHGPEQNVPSRNYASTVGTTRKAPIITTINSKAALNSNSLAETVEHSFPRGVQEGHYASTVGTTRKAPIVTTINSKVALNSNSSAKTVEQSVPRGFQEGANLKRKSSDQPMAFKSEPQMEINANIRSNQPDLVNSQEAVTVMEENRRLRIRCLEFQKTEEQLKHQVVRIKTELEKAQVEYSLLLAELQDLDKVKGEIIYLDV